MIGYSVGFYFNKLRDRVALILKARPAWQKNRFNGIGGHIEDTDASPQAAMQREFKEETGLVTSDQEWLPRLVITNNVANYVLHVFAAFSDGEPYLQNPDTAEPIVWHWADRLPMNVISNLRWIIPLCLDKTIKFPLYIEDTGN